MVTSIIELLPNHLLINITYSFEQIIQPLDVQGEFKSQNAIAKNLNAKFPFISHLDDFRFLLLVEESFNAFEQFLTKQ
jgi:hypothetical protein